MFTSTISYYEKKKKKIELEMAVFFFQKLFYTSFLSVFKHAQMYETNELYLHISAFKL